MDIRNVLILLGVVCALWGVVDSILIAVALDRRGVDINRRIKEVPHVFLP